MSLSNSVNLAWMYNKKTLIKIGMYNNKNNNSNNDYSSQLSLCALINFQKAMLLSGKKETRNSHFAGQNWMSKIPSFG